MLATIEEFKRHDMISDNWRRGALLKKRLQDAIDRHGLAANLQLPGYDCLFALVCRDHRGEPSDAFRTLMMQEMISRGVLFQGLFYPTWSHREPELDAMATAFDAACEIYRTAIGAGTTDGLLIGPPAKPVFRRTI